MLIQGIGDEVIAALVILLFVGLVSLLWLSTHVNDRPPVRAVVIRASPPEAANVSRPPNSELIDALEATAEATSNAGDTSEEETPVVADSADSSIASVPEISVTDSSNPEEDGILATIKIRFTNETSLEIKEKLSEKLGQFVSKHLDRHLNLTNEDRVRLIYNGRVLGRDQSTLAELGLKDNCVIHCLVQRSVVGDASENNAARHGGDRLAEDTLDLDLSNVCYPLLGTVLFIIWWCQVVYAHYFNFTSTMSLVSLTILFFASMANTYFVRA